MGDFSFEHFIAAIPSAMARDAWRLVKADHAATLAEVTAERDALQSERDGIVRCARADWDSKVAALAEVTAERDELRWLLDEARDSVAENASSCDAHEMEMSAKSLRALLARIDAALKGDDDE